MNASDFFENICKLEDRGFTGLRAQVVAIAEQRIVEHESLLTGEYWEERFLARVAIEVCKIVIDALSIHRTERPAQRGANERAASAAHFCCGGLQHLEQGGRQADDWDIDLGFRHVGFGSAAGRRSDRRIAGGYASAIRCEDILSWRHFCSFNASGSLSGQ